MSFVLIAVLCSYGGWGTGVYPKVSGLSHNEMNNSKHSLRSNTKGYRGKTH
jgi:hypothetical protein